MSGLLSQNQFPLGGLGGGLGGLAGMDLSDPNTAALVQQLLAQQNGGGSQLPGGLGSLGSVNQQPQEQTGGLTVSALPAVPQNDNSEQQDPGDESGQTVVV